MSHRGVRDGRTAQCARLDADLGVTLSTTNSRVDAPASATLLDDMGRICWQSVIATITIAQDSPHLVYMTRGERLGQYVETLSAPAQVESCYTAELDAYGARYNSWDFAGPVCWYGPPAPGGSGCGYTSTCEQSESCPLILDLNGDGIHTTGLEDPLYFWIDQWGRPEATAWTDPATEEAFLWIDLNQDRTAQVTELFGSRMVAPDGRYYANGFEALLNFDRQSRGGNGDAQITPADRIWPHLRLWVDRNHDGVSQPKEISVPGAHGIVALNLSHVERDIYDEHGNELYLLSSYIVRDGQEMTLRMMADVEFRFLPNE